VAPAHQGFEAHDTVVGQVQAWLVMQFQLVAAQCTAQFAFQVGQAARIAADPLVEQVIGTPLGAFGLLHGNVCVPHQRVGTRPHPGMRQAQTATDQQAFAVDPVRLGHGFDDAFGQPLCPRRLTTRVDQQGELVAAQPGQLIAGLQFALETGDHLQDQPVAGLMTQGVVGMAEVVQVQVTQRHAPPVVLGQARRQQRMKALAVGDAGQGVLLGQALQRVFQHPALAHMA